jgi:hypothetical protein
MRHCSFHRSPRTEVAGELSLTGEHVNLAKAIQMREQLRDSLCMIAVILRVVGILAVATLLLAGCHSRSSGLETQSFSKVQLDVSSLDDDGLRGPPHGKVAVAYEFAIPDLEQCRNEVAAIDRTVRFMAGSPGRVGAGEGQCLCIGSTHQSNYREVLRRLATLPYVDRIVECHFE